MNATVIRLLDEAQKELQSLRAENHSLRLQLHKAGQREASYIEALAEHEQLVRLLEGATDV